MNVTQQDIDTIVVEVLLQAVKRRERNEIGATIEHIVYRDDVEIGRIVIHPGVFGLTPTGSYKPTATEEIDKNTFIYICQRIQNEIDVLSKAAKMRDNQKGDGQRVTPWRGTGEPPKTKAEKIAAIQAWDSMNEFDRPLLVEWLETNFGLTPNDDLAVGESTFHGWRKLKKP